MIDEPVPEITDDMSYEEQVYIEARSKRQPEYRIPGLDAPKVIGGLLHKDQQSLIYSYVTEDQIDTTDIDELLL